MKVNATQLETRRPTALKFSVDLGLEYFDADYGGIDLMQIMEYWIN